MLVYQSVNWIEESQVHSFSAGRVVAEPPRRTDWAPSIRRTTRRSSTCAMSHRVAKAVGSLPLALLRFLRHLLQSRRWKLLLVGGFSNMAVSEDGKMISPVVMLIGKLWRPYIEVSNLGVHHFQTNPICVWDCQSRSYIPHGMAVSILYLFMHVFQIDHYIFFKFQLFCRWFTPVAYCNQPALGWWRNMIHPYQWDDGPTS